jgi:hypothetical protein
VWVDSGSIKGVEKRIAISATDECNDQRIDGREIRLARVASGFAEFNQVLGRTRDRAGLHYCDDPQQIATHFKTMLAALPAFLWQSEKMARGWESKSVESQIEQAVADRRTAASPERRPEELAHERERECLQLSRTRVLQDLAVATNPKYRELLERSLSFLNDKLAAFER